MIDPHLEHCTRPPLRATDAAMVTVRLTRHLYSFFPQLVGKEIAVEAATVGEVVRGLEAFAPGIGFYICDERGRLRTHVNIFVGTQLIRDRRGLSDAVAPGDEVHVLQSLSGG
jgi:molybdopterin converting factor small subunit